MPTLNWIGKEAVKKHHLQVPFHLLKDVPELACGQPGDGNLIVEGDNLLALKALLPYYEVQVKCIYGGGMARCSLMYWISECGCLRPRMITVRCPAYIWWLGWMGVVSPI
jgi:hypothetical protein